MDKVIIDGVDVSECKYYDDGTCCDKDILTLSCDKADCIYKQLKRLQAENERLEEENLKGAYFESLKIQALDEDNKNAHRKLKKYRQALQEIREICMSAMSYDFEKEEILDKINEVIGAE